jgi:hypothetical protein
VVPAVEALAAEHPRLRVWVPLLAYAHADLGHRAEVRRRLDGAAAAAFADLCSADLTGPAMALLSHACVRLRTRAWAAPIAEALQPFDGRVLVASPSGCFGAAAHHLGLLAALRAQWSRAERYFAEALALHEQMDAPLFAARTRLAWARALLARGRTRDRGRAATLRREAVETARALGVQDLGVPGLGR